MTAQELIDLIRAETAAGGNTRARVADALEAILAISGQPGEDGALIRRSDYMSTERKSYLAFAPADSLETDAVWSIAVTMTSTNGTVLSNNQYINQKWTERNLI